MKEDNFSYYSQLTKRLNGEIDYSPIADSKASKLGELDKETVLKAMLAAAFSVLAYLYVMY